MRMSLLYFIQSDFKKSLDSEAEGRVVEAPKRRFSEDLWNENKDLTETVDDLRF